MEWLKVFMIAIAAVGWIQWVKAFVPAGMPTFVYAAALLPISLGMAAIFFLLPMWIGAAVLALSLAQVGYEVLFQALRKFVGLA
jgi:hypothetical protein